MDRLNEDCFFAIFKHLDLSSRLHASKTCKLWRELLQDSMDDISEVELIPYSHRLELKTETLMAILSNIQHRSRLILATTGDSIVSDSTKYQLFRFGNIRLVWDQGFGGGYAAECLAILRESSITSLSISAQILDQSPLDLAGLNHLERLEIDLTFLIPVFPLEIQLPPALRGITISNIAPIHRLLHQAFSMTDRLLDIIEPCQLLEDLKFSEWRFVEGIFLRLFDLIQHRFSNLRRVHFFNIAFDLWQLKMDNRPIDGLPLEWIKFEKCTNHWFEAAQILINASNVKTVVISLNNSADMQELRKIYELAPLIKAKNATLELTIDGFKEPQSQYDRHLASTSFGDVLTKLELISVNYASLLKSFIIGKGFEKLTELILRDCIGFCDADFAGIAQWCLNLEKFYFKPPTSTGQNAVTEQCLQPFLHFWNDRKSRQLSIECLSSDFAFGWFQEPLCQDKGVFKDGKHWMQLLNWGLMEDGSNQAGMRMVIWDEDGKKMVIRDYHKDLGKKVRIHVEDGKCRVKVIGSR